MRRNGPQSGPQNPSPCQLPGRYCNASPRCPRAIDATPSRSASVRATFSSRWAARNDKFNRSQAVSSQAWSAASSRQWLRKPLRSRNALAHPCRRCCRSRASATRSATAALVSPLGWLVQRGGFARHGQVQVNAVQQRPRQLVAITLDLVGAAAAAAARVAEVAAGQGFIAATS